MRKEKVKELVVRIGAEGGDSVSAARDGQDVSARGEAVTGRGAAWEGMGEVDGAFVVALVGVHTSFTLIEQHRPNASTKELSRYSTAVRLTAQMCEQRGSAGMRPALKC